MKLTFYITFFFLTVCGISFGQSYKVVESTADHIKVEFNFENSYSIIDTSIDGRNFQYIRGKTFPMLTAGQPNLPAYYINIGIPAYSTPQVKIISVTKSVYENKFILPKPSEDTVVKPLSIKDLDEKIYGTNKYFPVEASSIIDDYYYRYARIIILNASPFQFNPVSRELICNKKILVEVDFGNTASTSLGKVSLQSFSKVNDPKTVEFLDNSIVNHAQAVNFIGAAKTASLSKSLSTQSSWFNPQKSYYKIYLKNKGLYRVTFDQLAADGVQMNNVPVNKLQLFGDGAEVPLYVNDSNHDGIFNSGDYFEFVGYPPPPTPYCKLNIYNNDNVYFFSTQADSSGLRYAVKDGYPNSWNNSFNTSLTTLHYERDSLFENLGYAGDDHRDFWLWDNISGQGGTVQHEFVSYFNGLKNLDPDSLNITIRVQLQGLTTSTTCLSNHRAYIILNSMPVGSIMWNGQSTATFEQTIRVAEDSFHIYPTQNALEVRVTGDACPSSGGDAAAVDWYEIDYWQDNKADTNHIEFSSPPNLTGKIKYDISGFMRDSLMVFIPQKDEIIKNAQIGQNDSVSFVDSVSSPTDYFCAGYDYSLTPDSIIQCEQSDLENTSNGADYIIIAHPDFNSVAERLANFRQTNFPDSSIPNPRIKIVYVNQIYNEFSNGLLDPFALQKFIQYAFYNWQKPSPSYVVLLGDMSHDFRHLLAASRPTFVPSIPYYTDTYGEGYSDNMMVAVSGNDVHPDLAIGRLSCETVAEGNILVDKLINYPADNSKEWKHNVLLISSGLDAADEQRLGLNYASVQLEQSYLVPNGIQSTKIMHFPEEPDFQQYEGSGPEIRQAFDNGTVLSNFYGHGGGYQWDLTFTNDDIALLNNGGRLPLVLSLTCYTAHFDDQSVFGEQFNLDPGNGSIGFFGNVGLTYWGVATYLDNLIFDQIFDKHNFIVGKVFQDIKDIAPATGYNTCQIALLTYLGDPLLKLAIPDKPDFSVNSSDIIFDKDNAVVNDTVHIKVKVQNFGVVFPNDSVTVQLFVSAPDTSYSLPYQKLPSFGLEDSLYFTWIPNKPDLYTFTAKVNEVNVIPEMDHSDNAAEKSFAVFNLNNPDIISPADGYSTQNNYVDFKIADIGYYISHPLKYFIQIDTSLDFETPVISQELSSSNGIISWRAVNLQKGIYFWRSRIYDGSDSSNWSMPRTFRVVGSNVNGYYVGGNQMSLFNFYNMNVTDSGLVLNSNYIPPRPSTTTFLQDIFPSDTAVFDSVGMTSITSDGKYLYIGTMWYYALLNNSMGYSKIYKIGTGYNGTVKGHYYGTVPNFYGPIRDNMFYFHDGYIYVATGDPYSLLRVDKNTGDTTTVIIPSGMIRLNDARVQPGSFYLAADSNYVYNLAAADSTGDNHYVLRTFDPSKNWAQAKPDMKLLSTSYQGFTGFFVADGYLFPYENYESGYMRRIRLSNGVFEEEWLTYIPFQGYYGWCYDWVNNLVYASVYRKNVQPKISEFKGRYLDADGTALTSTVGPASSWNSLSYSVENFSSDASYKAMLLGQNSFTNLWDTLNTDLPESFSLNNINANKYSNLKINFNFIDSSFANASSVKLKSVTVNYSSLPDISISNTDLTITPDSLLQGVPLNINLELHNYGLAPDDSATAKFYLNSADSAFYSKRFSLPADSSMQINTQLLTTDLPPANNITVQVNPGEKEFYTFNNTASGSFYILKDTTSPTLSVTFDGKELYSGDIVSPKPKISIELKDNSPLSIDTSDFSIVIDNSPLFFNSPDVHFAYSPYPNDLAMVTWTPKFTDGKHSLDILAKDHSGNYSGSSATHFDFYVYNQDDIIEAYNYPDPFKSDTYFTFQLTGTDVPNQLKIKIYTVAGRLIRDIEVPTSQLRIGFNRVHWDGKDQDGDDVANGTYLYQIVYKSGAVQKSVTQKLSRIR